MREDTRHQENDCDDSSSCNDRYEKSQKHLNISHRNTRSQSFLVLYMTL